MICSNYYREFEQTMADFRVRCTGAAHPKDVIDRALKACATFYAADRAYIVETDWDLEVSHSVFEWCREGVQAGIYDGQFISIQGYERWRKAHESGQPIIIRNVEQFADMPQIYHILHENGVHSMLLVPLAKRISGSLGVDNPQRYSNQPHLLELMSYVVATEFAEIKLLDTAHILAPSGEELKTNEVIINLFGTIEIHTARGSLTEEQICSKNTCRLIGYLLLNRKRKVPANELISVLWPGQLVDNPASAVKSVAYRARRIMDTICTEHIIEVMHGAYYFNPKWTIYTDAGAFEILHQKAKNECNIHRKISLYKTLLAYYKGDLAPSISDDNWILATASHYHLLFLEAVKEYATLLKRAEDIPEIQRVIFQAMKVEQTDGDLHYLLIKTLLSQGADSSAQRLFSKVEPFLSAWQCQELISVLKIS